MDKRILALPLLAILLVSGCISGTTTPTETPNPSDVPASSEGLFAEYSPVGFNIAPGNESYSFMPDDMSQFPLSQAQKDFLTEYGFVVSPHAYDVLFEDYYAALKDSDTPVFVTTDSMLHTFHILYDYVLRVTEQDHFSQDLLELTTWMCESSESIYDSSEGTVKEAAKMNVAYFYVALKLLEPSAQCPSYVSDIVEEELALVDTAEGIQPSPLFGYREDYSQYVPRGHYTRTDGLGRYFQAMMWYGRMTFRIMEREQTRSAILMVLSMAGAGTSERSALDIWDDIYLTTSFFVGDADDLTLYDYSSVMREVYGAEASYAEIEDESLLDSFIEKAKLLPDPKINSSVLKDNQDISESKGMRYMGQRFIVDSYMFSELVYDNVLQYFGDGEPFTLVYSDAGPIRGFPRGLDIFSVLGFELAEDILTEEGDTDYYDYDTQLQALRDEIAAYTTADWAKNQYTSWIYTLDGFKDEAGAGWPAFMQSEMWEKKELYTALGSWAELRHDTILYAKQSYTFEATSMPAQPELTYGFVEPIPEVYARLLSLTMMAHDGLMQRELLPEEFDTKFSELEDLLSTLISISEKEIAGEALSDDDYDHIWNIGGTLGSLLYFSEEVEEVTTEADASVAIIADVHTDVNSQMVLEEGVGYPLTMYVVLEKDGTSYIAKGPVFSYYEFKHPLDDRLTDEKWQDQLESGNEPQLPQWAQSFIIE